jgi:nitrogen regulatory protein PII
METGSSLNYVVAFIQPFQLDAVVDALRQLPQCPGMSVSDVRGFGAHLAHPPQAGEGTEVHAFKPKVRIGAYRASR